MEPDERQSEPTAETQEDQAPERSSRAWRGVRYVLLGLGWLVGIVVLLVLLAVLALQTEPGARYALRTLLDIANPYENAEITFEGVDGTLLGDIEVSGLRITPTDTTGPDVRPLARADTVRLNYDLLSLLSGTVDLQEVYVYDPVLNAHQQADGSWDLLAPFAPDTTRPSRQIDVTLAEARVDNAEINAFFYAPGQDSTMRIDSLTARIDQLYTAEQLRLRVDTLHGRFMPPDRSDWVRVQVGGSLVGPHLAISGLRVRSDRTDLAARGTLNLPGDSVGVVHDMDLQVDAEPLYFGDLSPFISALNPEATVTLDATVTGSTQRFQTSAEAVLGDGGSLNLDATIAPNPDGPLQYAAEGRVRAFDPGYLLSGEQAPMRFSADVDVDLAGTTQEALSGTFDLDVFDSRYAEYRDLGGTLRGEVDDGLARIDLATTLRGAEIAAEGTVRPFDDVPSYDLSGRVANLDIGRFTEGGTQESAIDAAVSVRGTGFDPQTATLRATVDLGTSTINQFRFEDAQLTARLDQGELTYDLAARSPNGQIAAEGQATLGDPLTYRVRSGRFDDLDVAALIGDTTRSRLNGTFSLRGTGTDPRQLDLSASASLTDSYYGDYVIQNAALDAELDSGRLRLYTDADLEGGSAELTAIIRPFAEPIRYEITDGTFRNVDISAFTQDTTQTSDLTGTLTLQGRGTSLDELVAEGRVTLDASRFNQQQIESGSFTFDLRNGQLTADAVVATPEGEATLAVRGDLRRETFDVRLEEGRFDQINLGALLNRPDLQTSLTGTVDIAGRGFPIGGEGGFNLQSGSYRATLQLQPSTINGLRLEEGEVVIETDQGAVDAGGRLAFEDGVATFNLSGRLFDERPTYDLSGELRNLDVGTLIGADTLNTRTSVQFDITGEGLDPATMALDAELSSGRTRVGEVRVDTLVADVRIRSGRLQVDTLRVRSNVLDAIGGGTIALTSNAGTPSDFRLQATVDDLAPLRSLVALPDLALNDGEIDLRVTGRPDLINFAAEVELTSLVYDQFRLAGFDGRVVGTLDEDRTLTMAESRGQLNYFSMPNLVVEDTRFDVAYGSTEIVFETNVTVDDTRSGRIAGRVDLSPDNQRLLVEDLSLRLDEDQWDLLTTASVSYGDEYRISNFLLYTEGQQIALDGVVDLDGEQSLILTVEQFRIGSIADLLGFGGLEGRMSGSLDLTGPADALNVGGLLSLDLSLRDEAVGTLRLGLDYDSLRLAIDARLQHVNESTLTLDGQIPMDLNLVSRQEQGERGVRLATERPELGEVDLQLQADSFAIDWVDPFLDPATIEEIGGQLFADVHIGGTVEAPVLDGAARLRNGVLRLTELDVTYEPIELDLRLSENTVFVEHAEIESDDGELIATGRINLPDLTLGEFDLEASAEDFLAIDSREYRMVASGDFTLQGTTEEPVLRGDVQVTSADFRLTDETSASEFEPVRLSQEDLQTLERRFGIRVTEADTSTFDFYQALTMDLNVELERDTWLRSRRNPEMDIQFEGDLDLRKEPYADVQLFGSIEVIPDRSRINQFGRQFVIERGTLTFNGPATDPVIDLLAEYDVRSRGNRESEVTIELAVEGRLDDLDVTLGSTPQMEETDIVSYIATGRPASEALKLGGQDGALTGAALSQITGFIETVAGSELGLDVIEIQQDGLRGVTTLTAGKYISSKFYAAVSQPISLSTSSSDAANSTSDTQITLEYELFDWLLLRLLRQGSTIRINLFWEYSY